MPEELNRDTPKMGLGAWWVREHKKAGLCL